MRMRSFLIAGITMLLAAWVSDAAQAQGRPSGGASIVGTARDAASGRALPRAHVCAELPESRSIRFERCAEVDSSVAFRLDSLPAGTWNVVVGCRTMRIFGKRLAADSVAVSEGVPVRRDWSADGTGCDPRPLRSVPGTFRGYFTPGFESSEFVPCIEDAWFLPSDSLQTRPYDERRAWAELEHVRVPKGFRMPDAPRDSYGNPRYYVRWRGTVAGPGAYGHMGVSAFELRVDSILELRAPRPGDCRPIQEPRTNPGAEFKEVSPAHPARDDPPRLIRKPRGHRDWLIRLPETPAA